ncbi:MAG: hypothetical protein Kow0099_14230 [Candidatus Abyssubacteria bacterium]
MFEVACVHVVTAANYLENLTQYSVNGFDVFVGTAYQDLLTAVDYLDRIFFLNKPCVFVILSEQPDGFFFVSQNDLLGRIHMVLTWHRLRSEPPIFLRISKLRGTVPLL